MSVYKKLSIILEGKKKQADIKSDKELTRAGASSSSDPRSKRYSPSLHTMHNDPESIKRRKHGVVIRRSNRSNKKHADDVARRREIKRQRDQAAIDRANAAEKKRKKKLTEGKPLSQKGRTPLNTKFKEIQARAEQHLADISDKKERGLSKAERRRSAIEALGLLKFKKPAKSVGHWRKK